MSLPEFHNRQALYQYFIDDRYVAGMVLEGTEVKSVREGRISFNDSYCLEQDGAIWVKSLHIPPYSHGTVNNHDPLRDRKLLLQKREIQRLRDRMKEKGYTLVPLRLFFNERNMLKLEIGLARGKKLYDKRETIKRREEDRELRRDGHR
jgi:SsrA-binding protein